MLGRSLVMEGAELVASFFWWERGVSSGGFLSEKRSFSSEKPQQKPAILRYKSSMAGYGIPIRILIGLKTVPVESFENSYC